jgi:hypothetical protein
MTCPMRFWEFFELIKFLKAGYNAKFQDFKFCAVFLSILVFKTVLKVYTDSDDRAFPMIKESGKQKLYFTGTDHSNELVI